MRGYVPIPSLSSPVLTTFMLSTDVDKLMQPGTILINDDSPDDAILEARDILKQTYPDIEEGYGYVFCTDGGIITLYSEPGFNISSRKPQFSVELLVNICKKYGTVRYFDSEYGIIPSWENAANEAGLVRSIIEEDARHVGHRLCFHRCTYRYDEKVQKRRLKKKGKK